jgi:hypothetical protein
MTQLYAERHDKEGTTMRTRLTIMAIVLAAAAAAVGTIALLVLMLGWPGLTIGTLGATTVFLVYRVLVQPWQHRWGATDEDVCRAMAGDDLVRDAASTTRAITIAAPPEQVWSRSASTVRTPDRSSTSSARIIARWREQQA